MTSYRFLIAILVFLQVFLQVQLLGQTETASPPNPPENSDFSYFRSKQNGDIRTNEPILSNVSSRSGLETLEVAKLRDILIHDAGRVKPLAAYAKTTLLIFNGKTTFEANDGQKYSALAWLAHTLFEPEQALDDRIFKITFEDVFNALGISPHPSKRYSFTDLVQGIGTLQQLASFAYQKPESARNALDKELIRIYEAYILYYQLLSSFVYALPSETFYIPDDEVRALLSLSAERSNFSYLEMMEITEQLSAQEQLAQAKSEKTRTSAELIIIELANRYNQFPLSFGELPFRLFPSYSHGEERWFTPWQIFALNTSENLVTKEIFALKNIVTAYRAGAQYEFDNAVTEYKTFIDAKLVAPLTRTKATWELFYHSLDPFYHASLLCGFAFLSMLAFFAFPLRTSLQRYIKIGSTTLLLGGLGLIVSGLLLRVLITSRPPITNLFSTFTFVAFVTSLGGVWLEKYEKRGLGILTGALSAALLLLISNYFATDGDTLHVLVAVLRSNFWLSTHVIAINLGYGGIVLSGVIAHVYLIKRIYNQNPFQTTQSNVEKKPAAKNTSTKVLTTADGVTEREGKRAKHKNLQVNFKLIYATQGIGIIFTVLGTILGGIWADQSWGRFWGWDPKENGSLLIILWSAILFHSKFGGMIRELGFACGAVIGIIVVMLAWFGVNLLGVGLHSYGFTEGIAYPLILYIVLQLTVLFFLVYFIKMTERIQTLQKS
ncbi:hypothetical protein COTS27_00607 [Spirochaetota bacterium]|nr:hypothetical protein COTS27_00607 [Spirochaetota bacterium]